MNTSAIKKTLCVTCNKSAGILTCEGCQQVFCGKHVFEHRQDLAGEFEHMMQDYDLIQYQIQQISTDHSLFKQIDQWEQNSFAKIQDAAETARKDLQELIDQSKEKVKKTSHDLAINLLASRQADDYLEKDFILWKEQFSKLELEIQTPFAIKMLENKSAFIPLIKIESSESINNELPIVQQSPVLKKELEIKVPGVALNILGPVGVEKENSRIKHIGVTDECAYVRDSLLYHNGQHTLRVRVENFEIPFSIFFGCTSSTSVLAPDIHRSQCSIGWFGCKNVYEHGTSRRKRRRYGHGDYLINKNDILQLTFDCDENQIKLYNETMKTTSILNVNIKLTPYPWQLLMVLCRKDDCVRIINDT
ncbi:unnamed protein product [Rotaria magnacalcarata]|uniref:B box-type domain-containing protein n=2 Tax=Rotaria magnacalcarata TaxID=392030 RepID=A0A815PHJ5_9BILA|nr:unnamed protein product [Rotaria magnacalcarata]CAF4236366.1 unnamed protein product [Rotaria magnacalcarata]